MISFRLFRVAWYSVYETVTVELMAQCMNIHRATGCEVDITVNNVGLRGEINELMFARQQFKEHARFG